MDTRPRPNLQDLYSPIRSDMQELSRFLRQEFLTEEPLIGEILEHIARFRGKQIRPALLFLTSKAFGAEISADHVKIAAVIELIHTATLVHDDVLDDAGLRRKVETIHRRWGERAAVLIGDYIYSRAFHLSTQVPGMAELLSDVTHTICEGELLQIENRFRVLDEAAYFEIIRKKTAVLYGVSCRIGGLLAGLDPARCDQLHDFGVELGMAFQIIDDCLDYSGRESVVGKSLGTDLRQGKMTLPLIYLLDCASGKEKEVLAELLRRPLSAPREAWVHDLVLQHGVLGDSLARAEAFVQSGKSVIAAVLNGDPGGFCVRESLELVGDYILRRRR